MSKLQKLKDKYGVDSEKESVVLSRLIYHNKQVGEDETLFTLEKYGEVSSSMSQKHLKLKGPINIYSIEIADEESTTEFYYLDRSAMDEFDDEDSDDEDTFCLLAVGEISKFEADFLLKK